MANRRLTAEELAKVNTLLDEVRVRLLELALGDTDLLFALRRKAYKELSYDERGKPMARRRLKAMKHKEQASICPGCNDPLPDKYSVLDRAVAATGYTATNTRLICQRCDERNQAAKVYTDKPDCQLGQ
jgi:hypothetical protein